MRLKLILLVLGLVLFAGSTASAGTKVLVGVDGTVFFNGFGNLPLSAIPLGAPATLSFIIDSDDFVDSGVASRRGYVIDPTSVQFVVGGVAMPAELPFPAGETPYFVVRDSDGQLDGFSVSLAIDDDDTNLPLGAVGASGEGLSTHFEVTYTDALIPTLDILSILSTYGSSGVIVYNWRLDEGPLTFMGFLYTKIRIQTFAVANAWTDEGCQLAGTGGDPLFAGTGDLTVGSPTNLSLTDAAPSASAGLFVSVSSNPVAFKGGTLKPFPWSSIFLRTTTPGGSFPIPFNWPPGFPPGSEIWVQWAISDAGALNGVALSNALKGVVP